ncbi:MAG: hypothetical protein ABI838_05365, partial [Chloroflexota bacterium]
MKGCLGSLRRRITGGGIALLAVAAAGWAMPAQAATPAVGGTAIDAVGHPAVVAMPAVSGPRTAGPKQSAPLHPMNPTALAEAKRRAGAAVAAAVGPHLAANPAAAPAPSAGVAGGLDKPGLSAADEGYSSTPPDTTGAIGPSHYVEFVNTTIAVYDRNLNQVSRLDMASFVGAAGGLNVSDPQVQWDPRGGRWFYAGVAFATHNNNLAFGWSKTADPSDLAAGWCRFSVPLGNSLPDYPKLGHDDNFVTFGANLYDDSTGGFIFTTAAIWALPKPPVGSQACSAGGLTAFADAQHPLHNADGSLAFTPVPANSSDATGVGYVVAGHSPVPEGGARIG